MILDALDGFVGMALREPPHALVLSDEDQARIRGEARALEGRRLPATPIRPTPAIR